MSSSREAHRVSQGIVRTALIVAALAALWSAVPASAALPGSFTLTSAVPGCNGSSPQIVLYWTSSSGATTYDVYRNGSLYSPGVPAGTLSFLNTGSKVSPGVTYTYFIRARNSSGTKDSSSLQATAPSTCGGSVPGSFSLTSANPSCSGSNPRITLNWTSSSGATTYDVYRNGSLYSPGVPAGTLTFLNTGSNVSPGATYTYFIRARNATGTKDSNTLQATAPSTCGGSVPGSFSLTSANPSCSGSDPRITLNWTSSSGATTYDVYRNGSLYSPGVPAGTLTFLNTGSNVVAGTTYSYFIRAKNATGTTDSNTLQAKAPTCSGGAGPGAFTLTSAAPACSGTSPQITLHWTASSGVTTYDVYRNGTLYSPGVPAGTLTFLNTGSNVVAGTTYSYFIRAKNATGTTDSNTLQAKAPTCSGGTGPGAFTLTSATPACSGTSPQITLNWTASSGVTTYDVYRNGTLYSPSVPAGTLTFLNTGSNVVAGTTYSYFIRAKNATGTTDSNTLQAKAPTCSGGTGPGAFTLTGATPACSGTSPQITLAWTASSGVTTYDVYRNGSLYSPGVPAGTLTFLNAGSNVVSGTTYTYFIRAKNAAGTTDSSSRQATAPTCTGTATPLAPTNLLVSTTSSTAITLTWKDNSTNETSFKVERRIGNAGWSPIGSQSTNLNFYNDTNLSASTEYCYRVRASNASGDSGPSNEACATTTAAPEGPGSFTISGSAYCTTTLPEMPAVRLSWKVSGGATSYSVFRNGAPLPHGTNLGSGERGFDDTHNVAVGLSYTYLVRAANANGSTDSNQYIVKVPATICETATPPADPGSLVATATSSSSIRLMWNDQSSNETGFRIERRKGGSATWSFIRTTGANVNTFTDASLSSATVYCYRIRATNGSGDSGYSNEACGTTFSAAEGADLVVESLSLNASTYVVGQTASVVFAIANRGEAPAAASIARLRLGGSEAAAGDPIVAEIPVQALPANTTAPLHATFIIPSQTGTRYVHVTADDTRIAGQTNTTNDRKRSDAITIVAASECSLSCSSTVPAGGFVSVPVAFALQPTACPRATYRWAFGDGVNGFTASASHTYKAAGQFQWKATIEANGESCETSGTITIEQPTSSTFVGIVSDAATGQPIKDASVIIGSARATTTHTGEYTVDKLPSGTLKVTVSKSGYLQLREDVSVPPSSLLRRNFQLTREPKPLSPVSVTSVATRFPNRVYFLDGVSLRVTFTANIYWGGRAPGTVRFWSPRKAITADANNQTASATFDVGKEIGACQKLFVQATAADGTKSAEKMVDIVIMSPPPLLGILNWHIVDSGDAIEYRWYDFGVTVLKHVELGKDDVPDRLPYFNEKTFSFGINPEVDISVTSDGEAEYGTFNVNLAADRERSTQSSDRKLKLTLANVSGEVTPRYEVRARFSDTSCTWLGWNGTLGITGGITGTVRYRIPATLYLVYTQLKVTAEADIAGDVTSFIPPRLKLRSAEVTGAIEPGGGIGSDRWVAFEINGHAGATLSVYPELDGFLRAYLEWRFVVRSGLFEVDHKIIHCTYGVKGKGLECPPESISVPVDDSPGLRWMPRTYLDSPLFGRFEGGVATTSAQIAGQNADDAPRAIQTNILPLAQPHVSSADSNMHMVWIVDDPSRSIANRATVVASRWDGDAWTAPAAIANDHTADATPVVIAFANGFALAAWENQSKVLEDDVNSASQVLSGVEISSAMFDPATGRWSQPVNVTANEWTDQTPQLNGPSETNTMLMWVANRANTLSTSDSTHDEVWSSVWNGSSWSAPVLVTASLYRIASFSFVYDGQSAVAAVAVDAAGGNETMREIHTIRYAGAQWAPPERQTFNNVADSSPKLLRSAGGALHLVWLSGDRLLLASVVDIRNGATDLLPGLHAPLVFDATSIPDGRIIVVWPEATKQSASDLHVLYYDPVVRTIGKPVPITADNAVEKQFSIAPAAGAKLVAVYTRTDSTDAADHADLYMVLRGIRSDVRVDADTLDADPPNPRPGSAVALSVDVVNGGDIPTGAVTVAVYPDTGEGAAAIAVTETQPIAPGVRTTATLRWVRPATQSPIRYRVIVDPARRLDDRDRSNDSVTFLLGQPDLSVEMLEFVELASSSVRIRARVMNRGVVPTATTRLAAFDGSQELSAVQLPSLRAGERFDAILEIAAGRIPASRILNIRAATTDSDFSRANDERVIVLPPLSTRRRAARP